MKFCGYCGAKLEDEFMFCCVCGARQPDELPKPQIPIYTDITFNMPVSAKEEVQLHSPMYTFGEIPAQSLMSKYEQEDLFEFIHIDEETQQDNIKEEKTETKIPPLKKYKRFIIAIASVAGAALVGLIIFFCQSFIRKGSNTMNGAVKEYLAANGQEDAERFLYSTMSDSMLEAYKEYEEMTESELVGKQKSFFDYDLRDSKYRDIEIDDRDYYSSKEVEILIDRIETETGVKVSVESVCEVEVSYSQWSSSYQEWNEQGGDEYTLYKSDGKWYVLNRFWE